MVKNKEIIKTLVSTRLSSKRIILFGAGKVAEEFYCEYKDKLNISHCVSNFKQEWGENGLANELPVRPYKREELKSNDYVVICGRIAFKAIEIQLKNDGFNMYEDFVEATIADAVFQGKKIALFYGGCILRDIYYCAIRCEKFTDAYAAVYTQNARKQTVVGNRTLYYMKDICDIYIYSPKVLDLDSVYSLDIDELPEDCKVVSVSNLIFSLYWPQVSAKLGEYNEYYLHPYVAKRDLIFYHTMFRREEFNITAMVKRGKSTEDIVKCLSAEDFYTEKQVIKNRNICFKLVQIAEKNIDIKIGDYLQDRFQTELVYQNCFHTNKYVIWEYVKRIMNHIGVEVEELGELIEDTPLYIHHGGDVPIYPSVAKHLNLSFINEDTKYEIMTENGIVEMTFQEYVSYYADYTRKVLEITKMW